MDYRAPGAIRNRDPPNTRSDVPTTEPPVSIFRTEGGAVYVSEWLGVLSECRKIAF